MNYKNKMMKVLLLTAAVSLLFSCSKTTKYEERIKKAKQSKKEIKIGVVGPWKKLADQKVLVFEGVDMAVKQVNMQGGIRGIHLTVVKEDDNASISDGRIIATKFSNDTDIIAVIGHYNSGVSLSASMIYEYNGVLNITPWSTDPHLTKNGLKLFFRTIPSTDQITQKMTEYSEKIGVKRAIVYNENRLFGYGMANNYLKAAKDEGVVIVDRITYDIPTRIRIFEKDLKLMKKLHQFDTLFISGWLTDPIKIVKTAKKLKLNVKFLIGGDVTPVYLLENLGQDADGIYFCSIFDPQTKRKEAQKFVENFIELYGRPPNEYAAEGYDSVMILVEAIKKANSFVPQQIADELRVIEYEGVTGTTIFTPSGELKDSKIILQTIKDGKIINIE